MRNTAITQVALIGISLVIIVSYIRPTFANIRTIQDEIFQYADATAKANEFNSLLQQLLARERSFSNDDKNALSMFLPSDIDQLAVMQDVESIITRNTGRVIDMVAGDTVTPNAEVEFEDYFDEQAVTANRFVTQEYEVRFRSDYQSFVNILRTLESTAYVLEIKELAMGAVGETTEQFSPIVDASDIEYTLTIKVYALAPQAS